MFEFIKQVIKDLSMYGLGLGTGVVSHELGHLIAAWILKVPIVWDFVFWQSGTPYLGFHLEQPYTEEQLRIISCAGNIANLLSFIPMLVSASLTEGEAGELLSFLGLGDISLFSVLVGIGYWQ